MKIILYYYCQSNFNYKLNIFIHTFPTDSKLFLSIKIMSDNNERYLCVNKFDNKDLTSFEHDSRVFELRKPI